MAIKITRKNSGLNRATAGFAAAFPQGLALGMQAKQNAAQEENRKQLTALAVQQAKQVSDQIDRELEANRAAAEGIGVLYGEGDTTDPRGSQIPAPVGGVGGQPAQMPASTNAPPGQFSDLVQRGQGGSSGKPALGGATALTKQQRLTEIAQRMAANGNIEGAKMMLLDAKRRETEAVNEKGLAGFRDKIARITSEGADKSDPEARPWMDPATVAEGDAEYANGLKNLSLMAADPNADPVVLDQQLGELIKKRAKSEGAAHGRANQFQGFTDQANNAMAAAGGSFAPEQGRAIRTMMSTFRQAPWIYDDPKAMQAFQAKFQDALQGYTTVGDQRVRFEDEGTVRNLLMQNAELKNRYLQSQIQSEQAQGRYYDAGAQGKLTPKALTPSQTGELTPSDRATLALKYRTLAEDPDVLDPAAKARYARMADEIERGGDVAAPPPGMLRDVEQRMGVPAQNGVVPPPGKVRTPQDAAAQRRALIATGHTSKELEPLADTLPREIQNAGG